MKHLLCRHKKVKSSPQKPYKSPGTVVQAVTPLRAREERRGTMGASWKASLASSATEAL